MRLTYWAKNYRAKDVADEEDRHRQRTLLMTHDNEGGTQHVDGPAGQGGAQCGNEDEYQAESDYEQFPDLIHEPNIRTSNCMSMLPCTYRRPVCCIITIADVERNHPRCSVRKIGGESLLFMILVPQNFCCRHQFIIEQVKLLSYHIVCKSLDTSLNRSIKSRFSVMEIEQGGTSLLQCE